MKAKVEIRIWSDDEQPDIMKLEEMLQPHVEHVAAMLARSYHSGDVVGDGFRGWWEIITD